MLIKTKQERIANIKAFYPDLTPDDLNNIEKYFKAFIKAVKMNKIDVLEDLIAVTNREFKEQMIHECKDYIFKRAATNGHIDVIKLLLEYTHGSIENSTFYYAFTSAATNGHMDIVKLLFEYDSGSIGQSVLNQVFEKAVANRHIDIVKLLFKYVPEYELSKTFSYAAQNGYADIMKLLLELTIDPVKRNQMIRTNNDAAFKDSIIKGHVDIIELLLNKTSKLNIKQKMIDSFFDSNFSNKDFKGNKIDRITEALIMCSPHLEKKEIQTYFNKYCTNASNKEQKLEFIYKMKEFKEKHSDVSLSKVFLYSDLIKENPSIMKMNNQIIKMLGENLSKGLRDITDKIVSYNPEKKVKLAQNMEDINLKKIIKINQAINTDIVDKSKTQDTNSKKNNTQNLESNISNKLNKDLIKVKTQVKNLSSKFNDKPSLVRDKMNTSKSKNNNSRAK